MKTLDDLLETANSLDWFELEPEEQQTLTNLETSVSLIHQIPGSGYYQTSITDNTEWGQYSHAIQADTIDGLHQMIFNHYKNTITQLTQNK